MKFCEFCNKTYSDKASFCATCGNRLVTIRKCPYCFADIEIGYKHCPECGKNLQEPSLASPRFERGVQPHSAVQQERDGLFRTNLETLLTQGTGGFVIFEERTSGMFVQYAQDGNTLRLDHPKPQISTRFTQEHAIKMRSLLEQELIEILESEDSIAADVGANVNYISYLTDTIFKQVFGLDATYEITVELSLDGEVTNVIGN